MKGARGRERYCQEASPISKGEYVPCGRIAEYIVDSGDEHPYWMCPSCAVHNVKNRGAVLWFPSGIGKSA